MPRYLVGTEARVIYEIETEASDEKDAYQQAVYEIEEVGIEWERMVQMKLRDIVEVPDAKSNQ